MYRLILLIVGLAFLPQLNSSIAAQSAISPNGAATKATKQETVHMRIAGMTCAACARGLEASFRRMAGVEKVVIDYKDGQAAIAFDPTKQNVASLSKFVTDYGYTLKEIKVM